jgi:glycine betaine/proline transport system substrate-binding protein
MGNMKLVYLTGFEKDGFGDAKINALTRPGYSTDCPNMGKLLGQLKFELAMESAVMDEIGKGSDGDTAATNWLKANPAVLDTWLAGVTTVDGGDGAAAVKKSLGL